MTGGSDSICSSLSWKGFLASDADAADPTALTVAICASSAAPFSIDDTVDNAADACRPTNPADCAMDLGAADLAAESAVYFANYDDHIHDHTFGSDAGSPTFLTYNADLAAEYAAASATDRAASSILPVSNHCIKTPATRLIAFLTLVVYSSL